MENQESNIESVVFEGIRFKEAFEEVSDQVSVGSADIVKVVDSLLGKRV